MKKAVYKVVRVDSSEISNGLNDLEKALNDGYMIERVDYFPPEESFYGKHDYVLFKWVDEEDNSCVKPSEKPE